MIYCKNKFKNITSFSKLVVVSHIARSISEHIVRSEEEKKHDNDTGLVDCFWRTLDLCWGV